MSIIKHKDKHTGVTYVYESESYWDKEKKQPRSKRTLIGKIDEATGEIVPTGKSGRRKKAEDTETVQLAEPITDQVSIIAVKDEQIRILKAENAAWKKEKQDILRALGALCRKISED